MDATKTQPASAPAPETAPAPPPPSPGVKWLTPDTTTIFTGTFSLLHCAVKNDNLYRGVYAVLLFPVSWPNRFVSLRYTLPNGKDREIGVIEELAAFPKEAQELLRASLARQYHEQVITRVYRVECEYGLLFFDVETQRGREQFSMPWRGDRAEDYGERGKVLHESLGNRYVIPDVQALPVADARLFTSYIYW
ncbi:MAG TPA: DUF1854 domain-containing protein [Candidatus Brocadiia bacterium]|nr:DUF1854 domain-containing protein [Candidatus Brocadiia bacterium]